MKTVKVTRDFTYTPKERVTISYKAGATYEKVPEAAVEAIVGAGAGEVVGAKSKKE